MSNDPKRPLSFSHAVVVGAGTMGHGIAQVCAMAGLQTTLVDLDEAVLQRGMAAITANLDKGVARGKVSEAERSAALSRLQSATDGDAALKEADLFIEAVPENMALKKRIFADADAKLPEGAVLGSNTSSLSITEIASATGRPASVIGVHFFNPVHIMKLVEVVRTEVSSDAAIETSMQLARRLGKDPILVKDSPGFASSRLGLVIGLEAMRMVESGVASAEDIDKAMTLGYGFPMGPLKLTDLVGLDVRLSIAEYLAGEVGEHFQPPAILRQKVAAGELGKKSGKGFYDWS